MALAKSKSVWAALALIVLLECCLFNMPHWRSLATGGASADQGPAPACLGPGLVRLPGGALKVSDPTQAWIETSSKTQPLEYLQVLQGGAGANGSERMLERVHVRLDLRAPGGQAWTPAGTATLSSSPSSDYLRNRSNVAQPAQARLWISEARGSLVAVSGLIVNPRVPFALRPARIGLMALVAALVIAFLPNSRLWRIHLDTGSRLQRLAFWLAMAPVGLWASWTVVIQIGGFVPGDFHEPGSYTYDFNQYGHLADTILAGRPWLDLPVAQGLAQAPNPYSVAVRERLLASGQGPIYWDYAFYQGHWYSYFGPLPALLLFAPYRALTSLFVPGGLMLPTPAAAAILVAGFTLTGSLLLVRLIRRYVPGASLGACAFALLTFLTGSQLTYLLYRDDFYAIPFDASILLSTLGLWLWLGARRVRPVSGGRTRPWRAEDNLEGCLALTAQEVRLSLPRLAAGSLAIGATLGCRQTFIAWGLLALPIFAPEIKAMSKGLRRTNPLSASQRTDDPLTIEPAFSAAILPAALLPVVLVALPLLAYNAWRFGSPLDFGNRHQITVVDLNRYRPPLSNLPWLVFYYLFQPLTGSQAFPYVQRFPAPLPVWQYAEPGLGGLFALTPILALALALLAFRRVREPLEETFAVPLLEVLLGLSAALLAFTAYMGGLNPRYMLDFSCLLALAAGLPLAQALGHDARRPGRERRVLRLIALACLLFGLLTCVLSCLTALEGQPLFDQVASWFAAF